MLGELGGGDLEEGWTVSVMASSYRHGSPQESKMRNLYQADESLG